MAKNKNKYSSQIPQQTTPSPQKSTAKLNGLLSAIQNGADVLQIEKPEWNESLFEDLYLAFPEDRRLEFQQVLSTFMQLGKSVSQAIENATSNANEYQKKCRELDAKSNELELRALELESQESEIKRRDEHSKAQEAALLKQSAAISIREENASFGFIKEHREAMKELQTELAELAAQRLNLQVEMHTMRDKAQREMEELLSKQLQALSERQNALDEELAQLEAAKGAFEQARKAFHREQKTAEKLADMIRQQVQVELQNELERRSESIRTLEQRISALYEENDEINQRLDEYRDIEQQLDGREPSILIEELDELRRQVRQRDRQIRDLEESKSRDDTDALRADRDRLEEELRNLRPELEDLRRQNHRDRMGVMERENWELEKRLLQKNNDLMNAGLRDLESRIKGLTEDQDHQGAFPELSRMDRDSAFLLQASVQQVDDLKLFTEELRERIATTQPKNPLIFNLGDLQLFVGGLAMSQLHVLQGISGTGKTSLAKAFAKVVGGECKDIAVQAGWRDRADLLGHYNAFERRYYEKDCLQALYKAQTPCASDRINVILLDEMNLSRPEQYFADFLSALEKESGDRFIPLMESAPANAPKLLLGGREILLPDNVWFIGTANQDETTNELADKTHDRAFVMELHSRHREQQFEPRKGMAQATYSASSLRAAFAKAQRSYREEATQMLAFVGESKLTSVLEQQFSLGWGNRLERQALHFLPVVKAAGGTYEMALDHLLATRMFRAGKVTGRYDVKSEDLRNVENALNEVWGALFPSGMPERCLMAIEKDIKRLERGG